MPGRLVLWDVDHTLINAGGAGWRVYQLAFGEMFGRDVPAAPSMAGRTDRAIALEALALAGVPRPRTQIDAFQRLLAHLAPDVADQVREQGRVLPGAAEAVRALAAAAAQPCDGSPLVQSVLTGNMRVMAQVKLGALGLDRDLDLRVGAYGDAHEVRADLVPLARASASAAYGADFSGAATVLVGDTPLDVEAAQVAGARAVAVASGEFSAADLEAAGADAVLPDLTDTATVLAAILGPARS
ncbi:MAG TPA: HAD hydrolase-like protein [Streptosporangiaceae bacterium]|nr:HAD hydrolase-like protein [Streptosporangiaceae bacterium]